MRKHFASKCSSSYEPNNFCENISQAFIFKHFQTFCIQMHIIVRAQNHSISIFADLPILQGPSMHRPSKVLFTNMLVKTNANHNFSNFSIHNCHPAIRNTIPTYIPSYRKRVIPTLARAPALSLTRSAQGKTSVPFCGAKAERSCHCFGDFLVVLFCSVVLLFDAINNFIEWEVLWV